MAEFTVSGPFDIPFKKHPGGKELIPTDFWDQEYANKSAKNCGVYIFAIKVSKGFMPHYVGRTKITFGKECFTGDKLNKYQKSMTKGIRGKPVMFFIEHPIQRGKINHKEIKDLEDYFIQLAYTKNPSCQNIKGVYKPTWHIRGITGGKPSKSVSLLKKAIGSWQFS